MTQSRDDKGHFIRGNVPSNKRPDSTRSQVTFTCKYCGTQVPIEEMRVATTYFPPLVVCALCWNRL